MRHHARPAGPDAPSPRWSGRRIVGFALRLLLLMALIAPEQAAADAAVSKEYQIKAAFLFNFIRFCEWPASSFRDAAAPITIGILGDDPFGPALEEVVHGETVRNRPIVVVRSRTLDDLQSCQLLYVSVSEAERFADILHGLAQGAVLVVSDIEHSAHHGGMIGFYQEGKRIRFEINAAAALERNLRLSAQLLSLGRVVDAPAGKGHQ